MSGGACPVSSEYMYTHLFTSMGLCYKENREKMGLVCLAIIIQHKN